MTALTHKETIDYLKESLVTLDFIISLINVQAEGNVVMPSSNVPFRKTATYQDIITRIETIKSRLDISPSEI